MDASVDNSGIRWAIADYLNLLQNGPTDAEKAIEELAEVLDRLACLFHTAEKAEKAFEDTGNNDDSEDISEAPDPNYEFLYDLALTRFPDFTPYRIPSRISEGTEETEFLVVGPFDDLADIASDLTYTAWRWNNISEKSGISDFVSRYLTHFGFHLVNLRWYVHAFEHDI